MSLRIARIALALTALTLLGADPEPGPTPDATPTPNARAERIFARAKDVWRARSDVPYVRYGALVRYLHNGHVFDNWWDAYYRPADGSVAVTRLVDVDEDRRRLRGVPFSIFGVKIFDTNPDSEPIRLDEPRIDPASSFGVLARGDDGTGAARPRPRPSAAAPAGAAASALPSSAPDAAAELRLREITRVAANTRDYQVELAGQEEAMGESALHLTLQPLHDPDTYRLRDLWLDPATYRTLQLRVAGLLNGQPYNEVPWLVRYVVVDGRQYVQQIVAERPLRFGLDTVLPKFEFDFVDFHFPTDVPKFTFDRPF